MKAYVLVQADPTRVRNVVDAVKGKGVAGCRVLSAEAVTGPYDVVLVCEGENLDAIGRCVLDVCARVQGVQRTLTCLVSYPAGAPTPRRRPAR